MTLVRDLHSIRPSRPPGHRRANVLEDLRPGGHASRLRHRAQADHRPHAPDCTASINALVKWAAVTALGDTAAAERVRTTTLNLRRSTVAELEGLGFKVLPSEANFFMVHIRRQVQPVIEEFRSRGIFVGRPFPPMLEHLRVSVGTAEEMSRFTSAFKEIVAGKTSV